MRSANRNVNNANNAGCVNASGNVNNTNASNGNFAAPDYRCDADTCGGRKPLARKCRCREPTPRLPWRQ